MTPQKRKIGPASKPRKEKAVKSRLPSARLKGKAGLRPQKVLSTSIHSEFEVELTRSFVEFLNGAPSVEAFAWVPGALQQSAATHGLPPPGKFKTSPLDDAALRKASLQGYLFSMYLQTEGIDTLNHTFVWVLNQVVNRLLSSMQVVTCWRVRGNELVEVSIPRLDTTARCCAYVIGLALLDLHGIRGGIKLCLLDQETKRHFFLDIPHSKQQYCCARHAATDRKRRERSTAHHAARSARIEK